MRISIRERAQPFCFLELRRFVAGFSHPEQTPTNTPTWFRGRSMQELRRKSTKNEVFFDTTFTRRDVLRVYAHVHFISRAHPVVFIIWSIVPRKVFGFLIDSVDNYSLKFLLLPYLEKRTITTSVGVRISFVFD